MIAFDVIMDRRVPRSHIGVCVITIPFLVEESVNLGDSHRVGFAHHVVGNNVSGFELTASGGRFVREFKGKEGESRDENEQEKNLNQIARIVSV